MNKASKTTHPSLAEGRWADDRPFTVRRSQWIAGAIIASSCMVAMPATVPNAFTSGSPAVAEDVNANFQALVTALTTAETNIATLQSTVTNLQTALTTAQSDITALQASNTALQDSNASLQASNIALSDKLASVSTLTVNGQPTVRFSGVNVQVVNGAGATNTINGTGNLIIGYDEADISGTSRCPIGMNGAVQVTAATCFDNGGGLPSTTGMKTGSHYLVLGSENNYANYGGIVAGYRNFSNWNYASVFGGSYNAASGQYASVSGGFGNSASDSNTSVVGGEGNTASGQRASVSGGSNNEASGLLASVSGGSYNTARNIQSSVSGGAYNLASGEGASVSGGYNNTASNASSSVSGGSGNTASGATSSVSGGQGCDVSVTTGWDVGTVSGVTADCSANVGQ